MTPMEHKVIEQLRADGYEVWQNGWPDLLVCKDGEFTAIEVKAKTDKLRRAQIAMHEALSIFGMDVRVVTLDSEGEVRELKYCRREGGGGTNRMAQARNDVVRLRLTTLEKQDWTRAAGGARKLSEWIRRVCNEAAAKEAQSEGREGGGGSGTLTGDESPVTAALGKPQIVNDAIEREIAETGLAGSGRAEQLRQEASAGQCPRWMHHRPGTYCGTCKKVIGK